MAAVTRTKKPGRNEPCGCGSGKKYKHCCESKSRDRSSRAWLFAIAGIIVAAILVTLVTVSTDNDAPSRVWSAEHGHWHDVQ